MANPSGVNTSSNEGFSGFTQPQDQVVYGQRKQMGALQAAAPLVPTAQPSPFPTPQPAQAKPQPQAQPRQEMTVPDPQQQQAPDPVAQIWSAVAQDKDASELVRYYASQA